MEEIQYFVVFGVMHYTFCANLISSLFFSLSFLFVPAIYDTTVIIPKDSPAPTMLRILKGQSSVVSVSTSLDSNC